MSNLKIETYIDGQLYTTEQFEAIQYQRFIHSLHEMKRLGADIKDGNKTLTHEEINCLAPASAKEISVATRLALGDDGMHQLFKEPLAYV